MGSTTCLAIVVFDIDGVLRDVGGSYRRAIADTVEHFTQGAYRPTLEDIDRLKQEGRWNNDWEASQELVYRHFEQQGQQRTDLGLHYPDLVMFFQQQYRGPDPDNPDHWTGYITQEPLLASRAYFDELTQAQIAWGFFSGATRGSAEFVLQRRMGLRDLILVAMEDAPGKPDPTGLLQVVEGLRARQGAWQGLENTPPVLYVGDTVADMKTAIAAQQLHPTATWTGIGILPPHVQHRDGAYANAYRQALQTAGAIEVFNRVEDLTPALIQQFVGNPNG